MNDEAVNMNDTTEPIEADPVYRHYSVNPFLADNVMSGENPTGGYYKGKGIHIIWQDGPRGVIGESSSPEKGHQIELAAPNGAFVEDAIHAAIQRLEFFQESKFRDRGNALAITKLQEALQALTHRRYEREARGVHGSNEV